MYSKSSDKSRSTLSWGLFSDHAHEEDVMMVTGRGLYVPIVSSRWCGI